MRTKLLLAILTVCAGIIPCQAQTIDIGGGYAYWSNISNNSTILIDGGTIDFGVPDSGINNKNFVIQNYGASFLIFGHATFLDGTTFTGGGDLIISTSGINLYMSGCDIDVGSVNINANGAYVVFDTARVGLSYGQTIALNYSSSSIFRFGTFTLDMDSYAAQISEGQTNVSFNLISSPQGKIDWHDISFETISGSFFDEVGETEYSYIDSNGVWAIYVGDNSVDLVFLEPLGEIPEPSEVALLVSGIALAFAVYRKRN